MDQANTNPRRRCARCRAWMRYGGAELSDGTRSTKTVACRSGAHPELCTTCAGEEPPPVLPPEDLLPLDLEVRVPEARGPQTLREQVEAEREAWTFRDPLARLRPRLRFVGRVSEDRPVRARLELTFHDHLDGRPKTFGDLFHWTPGDAEANKRAIWEAALGRLAHELGESLLHHGEPVCDPHARPRVWPWR